MKKHLAIALLLICYWNISQAQIEKFRDSLYQEAQRRNVRRLFLDYTDSLYNVVKTTPSDSVRAWAMVELSNNYKYRKPDSAVYFARRAIDLARNIKLIQTELVAMRYYLLTESAIGNHSKALQLSLESIKLSEKYNLPYDRALGVLLLGWTHSRIKQYEKAISLYKEALNYFKKNNDDTFCSMTSAYIGDAYSNLNEKDSALLYCDLAESYTGRAIWVIPFASLHLGKVHQNIGNQSKALEFFHQARIAGGYVESYWVFEATKEIANIYLADHQTDSALLYGYKALSIAQETGFYSSIIEANQILSQLYKSIDTKKALIYGENASQYKDSLARLERLIAIEDFVNIDESERQRELESAQKEFQGRLKMNALLGSSFTLLIVAMILYWSRRQKQNAKQKIEKAYKELKSTQAQLIQSEKMASLGELTAGIAHEIQNPLNFVNNFSEVNTELVDELKKELAVGNRQSAEELANDIKSNSEKINHHGKRADGIVKGMLQHSRSSSGVKEPTDINALADEYLRLAYHGLRAKDKSFNAKFEADFDPSLEKLNVVPQDIGRVILNLINNAFYAVTEKRKANLPGYEPTVTVSTKKLYDKVEIKVKDNGNGIPQKILDKIFQPFFTTKPTGQGTGLGLSLSYDIVKAHGGEIKIVSENNVGTTFTINLPSHS